MLTTKGVFMVDKEFLKNRFNYFVKKMELSQWNMKLEFVEKDWKNTGNVKVDMDNKTAIVYLNIYNPKCENLEEVMIHELCHVKLWKMDLYCESLLDSVFEDKESKEYKFGYNQFMSALEQTTQEIAKTYTKLLAKNKNLSCNRCKERMSFREE